MNKKIISYIVIQKKMRNEKNIYIKKSQNKTPVISLESNIMPQTVTVVSPSISLQKLVMKPQAVHFCRDSLDMLNLGYDK